MSSNEVKKNSLIRKALVHCSSPNFEIKNLFISGPVFAERFKLGSKSVFVNAHSFSAASSILAADLNFFNEAFLPEKSTAHISSFEAYSDKKCAYAEKNNKKIEKAHQKNKKAKDESNYVQEALKNLIASEVELLSTSAKRNAQSFILYKLYKDNELKLEKIKITKNADVIPALIALAIEMKLQINTYPALKNEINEIELMLASVAKNLIELCPNTIAKDFKENYLGKRNGKALQNKVGELVSAINEEAGKDYKNFVSATSVQNQFQIITNDAVQKYFSAFSYINGSGYKLFNTAEGKTKLLEKTLVEALNDLKTPARVEKDGKLVETDNLYNSNLYTIACIIEKRFPSLPNDLESSLRNTYTLLALVSDRFGSDLKEQSIAYALFDRVQDYRTLGCTDKLILERAYDNANTLLREAILKDNNNTPANFEKIGVKIQPFTDELLAGEAPLFIDLEAIEKVLNPETEIVEEEVEEQKEVAAALEVQEEPKEDAAIETIEELNEEERAAEAELVKHETLSAEEKKDKLIKKKLKFLSALNSKISDKVTDANNKKEELNSKNSDPAISNEEKRKNEKAITQANSEMDILGKLITKIIRKKDNLIKRSAEDDATSARRIRVFEDPADEQVDTPMPKTLIRLVQELKNISLDTKSYKYKEVIRDLIKLAKDENKVFATFQNYAKKNSLETNSKEYYNFLKQQQEEAAAKAAKTAGKKKVGKKKVEEKTAEEAVFNEAAATVVETEQKIVEVAETENLEVENAEAAIEFQNVEENKNAEEITATETSESEEQNEEEHLQ